MSEAIVVAVISATATVICQVILARKSRSDDALSQAVKDQETEDRLRRIEEKIDLHNGYAEKFSDISVDIAEIRKDIEHLKSKS